MTVDVVNSQNQKVGSVELSDAVFGGRVKADLIHESVVRANAADRQGTHATKTRGLVSGSGKKPWRQKGTGRAPGRRDPQPAVAQGRHGVRPAAAQLRVQAAEEGRARRAARRPLAEGAGRRARGRRRTGRRARPRPGPRSACCRPLGVAGKALLVDVAPDAHLALSVRNVPGVHLLPSNRITARDVVSAGRVVVTQAALEKLQAALGA